MKTILKYLLIIIGALVVIVIAALIFVNFKGIPIYETEAIDYTVDFTPERLERGEKLVTLLCKNCHYDPETGTLSGKEMLDSPPEFGQAFSPNITRDSEFGIGNWADGDILRLLRTGVRKDGQYTPPWMPKLPHASDEDISSIIAFLKSDDPLVVATNVEDYPSEPSLTTKLLCNVAFGPLPMPEQEIVTPDGSDQIALGRYLALNLECYTCHSADFKTINIMEPEKTIGYFGGGNSLLNNEGQVIQAQNLTFDQESGIGDWSKEEFITVVKTGTKDDEPALRYPMSPYLQLTDNEVGAIYEYLLTLPTISNKIERSGLDN